MVILLGSSFLQFFGGIPTADAAGLTTFTTAQTRTFEQNFSTKIHPDIPPSAFTFYPNGTIKLVNSQSVFLKFNIIPIPFQAPTSFQANSTYVIYSEKGPGPNCFLNWAFKEGKQSNNQGNVALVQMFGTASQPCAIGATISIKLNAFGSQLQALNSTGGTVGTLCDVQVASIEWNFCPAVSTLSGVTLTFSAETIQLKTTATAWSWNDPIALDGVGRGFRGASSSISIGSGGLSTLTTTNANDIIIITVQITSATAISVSSVAGCSLTWHSRHAWSNPNNDAEEWYAVAASALTACGATMTLSGTPTASDLIAFGVSGADTSTIFDGHAGLPAETQGSQYNSQAVTFSTSNANDFLFASLSADTGYGNNLTPNTGWTKLVSASLTGLSQGSGSINNEYEIVSAAQSSATVNFQFNPNTGNYVLFMDAIMQAGGNVNYVFTISATVSITPNVQNNIMHKVSDTISIAPSIAKNVVHSIAATVSIVPSVMKASAALVSGTISISESVQNQVSHLVSVTVSIAPTILCAMSASFCGNAAKIAGGDSLPYTWLLLIPLIFIMFLVLRKR